VEELAAGSTYPQVAEAAGVSLATVKRAAVHPRVQAAVRQVEADDRAERAKQRRLVQRSLERLAGFSLAKLQEVLLSQAASDGVKVQAAATILKHAAPVLVEVTVSEDEVQWLSDQPMIGDLFEVPEDADEAAVIQLARAVDERIKAHEHGVVDGQARRRPAEQVAAERVEEDERRAAMKVPLPSSPAPRRQEPVVAASVARARDDGLQEEQVQQLAAHRARVEADQWRAERAGLVPPPPPWEMTDQHRLEQLRRGNGRG
jgi:hypothetical protein